MSKWRRPLFLVKVFNYEYWPVWVFYFPIFFYWMYLSLKARTVTFFTSANPGIDMGGFFGESKSEILDSISLKYRPKNLLFDIQVPWQEVMRQLKEAEISFPVVMKPDVGERGFLVEKIENEKQLTAYLKKIKRNYIIQEWVDYDLELGVMYYRFPDETKGAVTSLTQKEFLSVTGDGMCSVLELMQKSPRARLQIKRFKEKSGNDFLNQVLREGEELILEPIGNHSRGTRFINVNEKINDTLSAVFDDVAKNINGFYYGRFDIKVKNWEDLYAGDTIRVMELNGVTADPTHIFDKNTGLLNAYRDICKHMDIILKISRLNRAKGVAKIPFRDLSRRFYYHYKMNGESF